VDNPQKEDLPDPSSNAKRKFHVNTIMKLLKYILDFPFGQVEKEWFSERGKIE